METIVELHGNEDPPIITKVFYVQMVLKYAKGFQCMFMARGKASWS
jgi:hypothetical protein